MKVISLFSGCGGLDLGFKWAGLDIIFANDIEEDACKTYKKYIGEHVKVGDINHFIEELPSADIVVGGPPCQSFSLSGKRLENDPRGELVFSYYKAVKKVNPSLFLMENVPGLIASKINGEKLVDYLNKEYKKIGYITKILKIDASDYFVPQRRKRVFMIGMKKDINLNLDNAKNKISALLGLPIETKITVHDALGDLPEIMKKNKKETLLEYHNGSTPNSYSKFMRQNVGNFITFHNMPTMSEKDKAFIKYIPPGGNYTNIPDKISTQRIMNFKRTGGRTTTYGRLHPEFPAYTINTYFNRPNVGANYHYREERLITVREAMRLQSFPDDFEPVFSNQRSLHMQVGNAVPPLLGWVLAESIKEILETTL